MARTSRFGASPVCASDRPYAARTASKLSQVLNQQHSATNKWLNKSRAIANAGTTARSNDGAIFDVRCRGRDRWIDGRLPRSWPRQLDLPRRLSQHHWRMVLRRRRLRGSAARQRQDEQRRLSSHRRRIRADERNATVAGWLLLAMQAARWIATLLFRAAARHLNARKLIQRHDVRSHRIVAPLCPAAILSRNIATDLYQRKQSRVGLNRSSSVIPGREFFASEPGIHNHHRAYGFRVCA